MIDVFVPGRLCLFGEHSDWAGAYRVTHPDLSAGNCLVTGTAHGLFARAERLDGAFEITSVDAAGAIHGPVRWSLGAEALGDVAGGGGFFAYVAGTVAEMLTRHPVGGMRLEVHRTTLPVGKGLSSSAAICVLVARSFGQLYGLGLSIDDEMALAYAGERRTGSACGRMDQVCAYGQRTLRLTFDGASFGVTPVRVGAPVHLVVADLQRHKDTRRILADLNACFPESPGALAGGVREALGIRNAALVEAAERALGRGDAVALGALMIEAQQVFDQCVAPASPELAAPRLHEVLLDRDVRGLALGGKGVGSQGDGSAQFVVRDAEASGRLARLLEGRFGALAFEVAMSG